MEGSKTFRSIVVSRKEQIEGLQAPVVDSPDPHQLAPVQGENVEVIDRPDELDGCEVLQSEPMAMAVVSVREPEFERKDVVESSFDTAKTVDAGKVAFSAVKGSSLTPMRFFAVDPIEQAQAKLREAFHKTRQTTEEILSRGYTLEPESRTSLGTIKTENYAIYLQRVVRVVKRPETKSSEAEKPGLVKTTKSLLGRQSPLELAAHPAFRTTQMQARVVVRGDNFEKFRKEIVAKLNGGLASDENSQEPVFLPEVLKQKKLKAASK
jgi:hypothetical protein